MAPRTRNPPPNVRVQLSTPEFAISPLPAANVAQVPLRSPLRYPGGKTWLVPHIRAWLDGLPEPPHLLVEPFVGGGIVSLTAVMEDLADRCLIADLDRDVAAFWHAALRQGPDLSRLVREFTPTRESVGQIAGRFPDEVLRHGFRTLVLNRTRRGGILATGAALIRSGESGRGLTSRWYPETICRRLGEITAHAHRITFCETDGQQLLDALTPNLRSGYAVFLDPPYTAGGKRAGARLYAQEQIDHERLFATVAESSAEFLMTYDRSAEVISLIQRHNFSAVEVIMKNTHHDRARELVITRNPLFPA